MVMTGWLQSHSIETPLDPEKAQGKAEIMRNRALSMSTRDMVWTLMQLDSTFLMSDDVLKFAFRMDQMPSPNVVTQMQMNPSFVHQLVQKRAPRDFDHAFNKDVIVNKLESLSMRFRAPTRFYDKSGDTVPSTSVIRVAMGDIELFYDWLHQTVETIFDSICEEGSSHVMLEAVNLDVPTERPLNISIETESSFFKFDVPWYGRQVIQHDVAAFLMMLMVSIAKDLEE